MSTTDSNWRGYLPRAGMFIGFVGVICFVVFVLLHMQDMLGRYSFMGALIPIPFVSLFLGWKRPFIGGALLVALGVVVFLLHINFPARTPEQLPGLGLGFTSVFVTLPLLASGVLFLLSGKGIPRKQ